MTVVSKPHYTEVEVQAPYALIKGSVPLRATLDLRDKIGAYLKMLVAGGGTTDLSSVVMMRVLRTLAANAAGNPFFAVGPAGYQGRAAYGARTLSSAYSAGVTSLAFTGSAGTSASVGDSIFFWGVTTIPTASGLINPANGCESNILVAGTSSPMTLLRPTNYAKLSGEYWCQCDILETWIPGGEIVELTWDYSAQTTGEAVACHAWAQTLDYYYQATV